MWANNRGCVCWSWRNGELAVELVVISQKDWRFTTKLAHDHICFAHNNKSHAARAFARLELELELERACRRGVQAGELARLSSRASLAASNKIDCLAAPLPSPGWSCPIGSFIQMLLTRG